MTTKADTSVKWFHSGMADAPALSGQAGKLIDLLDACLINGFSVRTPDSVVVSGGVATVSISAGNPYDKHAVIEVAGASDPALNAQWRIASASGSSFSFACPGVADGTISGATIKRAGAGWGKPFSDTNVAVYQSQDPNSTQLYLQITDTNTRYTRARGYVDMTSATDGAGDFPLLSAITAANFTWPKSDTASAATRDWVVVADGSFVWVLIKAIGDLTGGKLMHHFGDIVAFNPLDKYGCTITALLNTTTVNGVNHPGAGGRGSVSVYGRFYARGVGQTGGPVQHGCAFASYSRWTGEATAVPLVSDKIHVAGPVFTLKAGGLDDTARGILPGVVCTIDAPAFPDLSVVDQGDRAFLAVEVSATSHQIAPASLGVCLFDIKGPWR